MKDFENINDFSEIHQMDYSDELLKEVVEAYMELEGGISPETMASRFPEGKGVSNKTIRNILDGGYTADTETIKRIFRLVGLKLIVGDDENRILRFLRRKRE